MKVLSALMAVLCLVTTSICVGCTQEHSLSKQAIAKIETKIVQVGDIDIAYKTFGEGAPLLLVMGYSGTIDLW